MDHDPHSGWQPQRTPGSFDYEPGGNDLLPTLGCKEKLKILALLLFILFCFALLVYILVFGGH